MKSQLTKKRVLPEHRRRVFVGLSGGVDSAVSAALLKKAGNDVTGVFIKAWQPPNYKCTWIEDRRSAMRAAAILDIPFITLDLEDEYKREVVDYMIAEYKKGNTPNPDVMCNKEIKFGEFLKFALKNGADYVATGHYAQKLEAKSLELRVNKTSLKPPSFKLSALSYNLSEAKDKSKDQSYFLWTLTQGQLKHVLFPVGNLKKEEVRKLAQKFGLPQATRKDSQGLCFLGQIDMKDFLSDYLEHKKGKVLDEKGKVIGEHDGAVFFTVGERHGFSIYQKTANDVPLYVIAKDIKKNTLTVAPLKKISKTKKEIFRPELASVNWISKKILNKKIECRYRYRQEKIPCKIIERGGKTFAEFEEAQPTITSGQSIVFYDREECLGGGIIV